MCLRYYIGSDPQHYQTRRGEKHIGSRPKKHLPLISKLQSVRFTKLLLQLIKLCKLVVMRHFTTSPIASQPPSLATSGDEQPKTTSIIHPRMVVLPRANQTTPNTIRPGSFNPEKLSQQFPADALPSAVRPTRINTIGLTNKATLHFAIKCNRNSCEPSVPILMATLRPAAPAQRPPTNTTTLKQRKCCRRLNLLTMRHWQTGQQSD